MVVLPVSVLCLRWLWVLSAVCCFLYALLELSATLWNSATAISTAKQHRQSATEMMMMVDHHLRR